MKQKVIIDTIPLVAFIYKGDNFHNWAIETWKNLAIPLFTCEAVISEACFLLRRTYNSDFRIYRKNKNEMIDLIISDQI